MSDSMTISLPGPLRRLIEQEAAKAGFRSSGEYVQDVLRREAARLEREAVDEKLVAAAQGPFGPMDWPALRQTARSRRGA